MGIRGICDNIGRTHFPKGHIPWNKGLKKGDHPSLEKTGFKIGHPKLPNCGRKKGCIPWIKGKKHSEKSKKKMSLSHKGQIPWIKGKKFSKEYREKLSIAHKGKYLKEKSPKWKGGIIYVRGYAYVLKPEHPFCECKGYVKRSRLIMEEYLGRYLTSEERVHHINKIKDDDRIENLQLFDSNSGHATFHNIIRKRNSLGQFIS